MKRKLVVILTGIILSISTYSFADVGSFDRYDSGSSSDWGSSSSSSSDWSSSSSSSSWDDDDDYSRHSTTTGVGINGIEILGVFVFMAIAYVYMIQKSAKDKRKRRNIPYTSNNSANRPIIADINQEASNRNAEKIQQIEPIFSEQRFIAWSKELFIKLQNAWTKRDWEPIRPLETEILFELHLAQIQDYIESNRINVIDRISITYAYIYAFRQENGKDIIEVALKSVMKDYVIDATTKEVVEGNKEADRGNLYRLTFERTSGVKTMQEIESIRTMNCPNCGAPTQITSSGKCDYCGSVITTRDYGWVLANLEPFRR